MPDFGQNFQNAYANQQKIAMNNMNLQNAAQGMRDTADTRNAYAAAMQGGGTPESLRAQAQRVGAQGNISGSQQLFGIVSNMDAAQKQKLEGMINKYSPYFLDLVGNYKKDMIDAGNDPVKQNQVNAKYQEQYAKDLQGIQDPYEISHLPKSFNPMTAATFIDQGTAIKMAMAQWNERAKLAMKQLENKMGGTPAQKDFEILNPQWSGKSGTPEYAKAFGDYQNQKEDQKNSRYAKGRFYSVFNLESGKIEKKSGDWMNKNPNATIADNDADVAAYKKQQEYSTGISRFTNRIQTLGDTILNTMKKNGLNTGSKLSNYTVQDLIDNRILGAGDVAALRNQISAFGMELGKAESGSIGIAGATVEAVKQFQISPNMPASEFVKFLNGARDAAQSVTDAMNMTKRQTLERIYAGTGKDIPQYLRKQTEIKKNTDAGAPSIGTIENGYRFKGGDPGKQENWEKV